MAKFGVNDWNHIYFESIEFAINSPDCPPTSDYNERIKFILNHLSKSEKTQYVKEPAILSKSKKASAIRRSKGNDFFTSKEDGNLDNAVEEYTKSVVYAPPGSEELALAFANRSAALFKARMISGSLNDIERALKNKYPDNLKAKLYLRRAMCMRILNFSRRQIKDAFSIARKWVKKMDLKDQKMMEKKINDDEKAKNIDKSTFFEWTNTRLIPRLDSENPNFLGASDAVELKYSEKFGRHIVAARDIRPGETLMIQTPYATIPFSDMKYKYCCHCSKQTWASVPCDGCSEVVFCSESCFDKAKNQYHDLECPIVGTMTAMGMKRNYFLCLRLTVKAHKEVHGCINTLKRNLEEIDATTEPLMKGFTNGVFDPSKFASAYCLAKDESKLDSLREAILVGGSILIAYFLATKTHFFGRKINGGMNVLKDDMRFIFIIGLLGKNFNLSVINNFAHGSWKKAEEDVLIVRTVVPGLSFFNHSCIATMKRTFYAGYMIATALYPIEEGEQIFENYGAYYTEMPRNQRQQKLFSRYNFICDCEACVKDWSTDEVSKNLPAVFDSGKMYQLTKKIGKRIQAALRSYDFSVARTSDYELVDLSVDFGNIVVSIEHYFWECEKNSKILRTLVGYLSIYFILAQKPHMSLN